MHKIYIGQKCLVIRAADTSSPSTAGMCAEGAGIVDTVKMFRDSASTESVCIATDDEQAAYRSACSAFKEVNAAGGLVRDEDGACLMIMRSGRWDLPKGHQENGEDIRLTAVREVQEETGVENPVRGGLICVTDHCYLRDGIWHLKHTWWYAMTCTGHPEPVPQTEEDISGAAWIPCGQLHDKLAGAYPSIKEVFAAAGIV